MSGWVTGADERDRFAKLKPYIRLFYIDAGAWARAQYEGTPGPLPDEWFIPSSKVREMGGKNYTSVLVAEGLFRAAERDGVKGFVVVAFNYRNTPEYLGQQRERFRREHDRKRRARQRRKDQPTGSENDGTTWG